MRTGFYLDLLADDVAPALTGIRVLDFTRFLPGPLLCRILADHGAEVIKVESPDGDPVRGIGKRIKGQTTYFREINRNKKSIVLDLRKQAAHDVVLKLAERADVLVENFRPGSADKLGIGYPVLKRRNPALVYCSLSAFGQTGPRRNNPSRDLGVQALSGFLELSRGQNRVPAMPGAPAADIAGGLTALCGILMALFTRHTTGRGAYIDASMFDSLMAWTPYFAERGFFEPSRPPDEERWWGGAAFYGVYRTSDDRYVTLSGTQIENVMTVLDVLGRPDLATSVRDASSYPQDEVRSFLSAAFLSKTQDEWVQRFAGLKVAFDPVLDVREAYSDPHTLARDILTESDSTGEMNFSSPIRFDTATHGGGSAPCLGEHTDAVLAALGYSVDERRALYRSGACASESSD